MFLVSDLILLRFDARDLLTSRDTTLLDSTKLKIIAPHEKNPAKINVFRDRVPFTQLSQHSSLQYYCLFYTRNYSKLFTVCVCTWRSTMSDSTLLTISFIDIWNKENMRIKYAFWRVFITCQWTGSRWKNIMYTRAYVLIPNNKENSSKYVSSKVGRY